MKSPDKGDLGGFHNTKSAQSVSSAIIRDSDENINMLKKSAEIPKQNPPSKNPYRTIFTLIFFYKHFASLGLRILYHQNLLKSVSSASSAIIRDSDENINMPPLQGLGDEEARFYKHSVLTGLKRFLKSSRFPRSIRFGWNAGRKCKAETNFAAYGQNLGVYAAKPNLLDLGKVDSRGYPCE